MRQRDGRKKWEIIRQPSPFAFSKSFVKLSLPSILHCCVLIRGSGWRWEEAESYVVVVQAQLLAFRFQKIWLAGRRRKKKRKAATAATWYRFFYPPYCRVFTDFRGFESRKTRGRRWRWWRIMIGRRENGKMRHGKKWLNERKMSVEGKSGWRFAGEICLL